MTHTPIVTIVMPCRNEEKYISRAIDSLIDDYVMQNAEILIIDGISTDNTSRIIDEYIQKHYPIRLIPNQNKLQCFAMNLGITQAIGKYLIRVDAHSFYPPNYVQDLVSLLETTDAVNVGGIMLPKGNTPTQQAIALAMQHPVGVGNARFHLGNYKGYVDTVYLGAFRKEIFDRVGLFDTNCRTNEDAELNIRILNIGEKIYLDSAIHVEYLPRETFSKLAIQYYRYGIGRAYTTTKHKRFTSFRQVLPPLLVLALIGSLPFAFLHPLFLLAPLSYILITLFVAFLTWRNRKISFSLRFLIGIAFIVMHTTWGTGFLVFFIKNPLRLFQRKSHV